MSREYTFAYTGQVGVWRVALVAPKIEAAVIAQLKPSLFEFYRPTVMKTRKVNGRGKVEQVQALALPGYLFIRNLCPNSPPLSQIIGVNDVLPFACSPAVIDRARIVGEAVAAEVARGQAPKAVEVGAASSVSYAPGDVIETLDGHWRGIFTGLTPKNRIAILCLMLGAERIIEVSPENIRPSPS